MATSVQHQPHQAVASAPRAKTPRWQPTGRYSWRGYNGVQIIDLTGSDEEGPIQERQTAEDGQTVVKGEPNASSHSSRESTITVIEDSDEDLDLPALEDVLSKFKAMRRATKLGQEPQKPTNPEQLVHNGSLKEDGLPTCDEAAGHSHSHGAGTRVGSLLRGGSQDEPIVLDDDDDDDEDRTLKASPPPSPNNHHTSVLAIPTENLSEHSDRDVSGLQDRRCTTTPPNHTDIASGGLSTGHFTNIERDGCEPCHQMNDLQHREPTRSNPSPPSPLSRKRPGSPAGSHAPSLKRRRRSSRVAARTRRAEVMPTRLDARKEGEQTLHHVFPRRCRDKDWKVDDIGCIYFEADGSLICKLLWAPTTAPVSSLKGALLERAEELVKQDFGADAWDKWLEM